MMVAAGVGLGGVDRGDVASFWARTTSPAGANLCRVGTVKLIAVAAMGKAKAVLWPVEMVGSVRATGGVWGPAPTRLAPLVDGGKTGPKIKSCGVPPS